MNDTTATIIRHAAERSGLQDYTGAYHELGGGEVNDTYVLSGKNSTYVLRICRYTEYRHLHREAGSLKLLDIPEVPKVLYFNEADKIDGRPWIMETYIEGHRVERLNATQYESFGKLLARIHSISQPTEMAFDYWHEFVVSSKHFGTEHDLLHHPDAHLRALIRSTKKILEQATVNFQLHDLRLTHLDSTPSNILVYGDSVRLIDWEFSGFKDPMADFAASYYDDMEFNQGKWRPMITNKERDALFYGYKSNGGVINQQRLNLWMQLDKLKAAVFLYWRIRQVDRHDPVQLIDQYSHDFENIIASLEQ